MTRLFPFTIEEQIACVEREIRFRERVYARRVSDGKMSHVAAEKEIDLMNAVLDTLKEVRDGPVI